MEHLYEKVAKTAPGQLSHLLRQIHYEEAHKISEKAAKELMNIAAYLEGLAIEELKKQIPPWVEELNRSSP